MHLALFAPSWPPGNSANGIVTYVDEVKKMLEAKGSQVTILTIGRIYHHDKTITEFRNRPPKIISLILRYMDNYKLTNYLTGRIMAAALKKHCNEIEIFEMEESFGWIRGVQEQLNIPVVLRLHGPEFLGRVDELNSTEKERSDQKATSEGLAIKNAKYISAPSRQILDDSIFEYKASPHLARSYPNPMDPGKATAWQFDGCKKHQILHVGRFDRRKGADVIIDAFCQIAHDFPSAKLLIVGPETGLQDKDGKYLDFREYLDRYVNRELKKRIDFLGKMHRDEIERLRCESHVCVVPSRFEVLPYSALEALAAGAPLIVADGFADDALVIDGESGWMAKNGSPDSFADKLREAFALDDRIEGVGRAGRAFFLEHFAAAAVEIAALQFYEDVLADSKRK